MYAFKTHICNSQIWSKESQFIGNTMKRIKYKYKIAFGTVILFHINSIEGGGALESPGLAGERS